MDLTNFLNLEEEIVKDSSDDIEDQIIEQLIAPDVESDEEVIMLEPKITPTQALEAVRLLRLWEEQSGGDSSQITVLNVKERQIMQQKTQSMQEGDIRMFFV